MGGNEANAPSRNPFDDGVFNFGSGDFTIQVWVNWANGAATSGEQVLLEKFTGPGGPGWTLTRLSDAQLLFFGSGAVSVSTASPPNIILGSWQQFAARRSGTDLRLFHNGGSVAFTTIASDAAIPDAPEPLLLGARDDSQDFPLNAGADDTPAPGVRPRGPRTTQTPVAAERSLHAPHPSPLAGPPALCLLPES